MTDHEIENRLHVLVREERRITDEILSLIREAESRRIFLDRGFPNMYEWLTKRFGYSHGAAHRRIQAARLVHAVPEVGEKLQSGTISLSSAAALQSAMRKEERRTGEKFTPEEKFKFVSKIEGKTALEAQSLIAAEFPEVATRFELVKPLDERSSKVTLVLEREAVKDLERARELLSHILPNAGLSEVVAHLAKSFVEKKSASDKRRVTKKDACEFKDPKTGKICGSRWQLEIDHIMPKALGGSNDPSNLRCLCRAHNQHEASKFLGFRYKAAGS